MLVQQEMMLQLLKLPSTFQMQPIAQEPVHWGDFAYTLAPNNVPVTAVVSAIIVLFGCRALAPFIAL